MSKASILLIAAMVFSLALTTRAQTNSGAQRPTRTQVRQEPCWQQVGITQEAKEQRDAIARDTRSQVQQVCADSSLSDQQKKQKIHEIRQESKQKVGGLISEQQQEQLQACQKERAANHPTSAGPQHGGGPCAEFASPQSHAAATSGEANR